jgi:hypothetical protein
MTLLACEFSLWLLNQMHQKEHVVSHVMLLSSVLLKSMRDFFKLVLLESTNEAMSLQRASQILVTLRIDK